MQAKNYIADLTGGSLLISESRVVAETLLQGYSEAEWKELIVDRNILRKRSPHTSLRYARTIKRRLAPLGESFIHDLTKANDPLYVQMLMVSLMVHSPVLPDFMSSVVSEARRVYKTQLTPTAWDGFIEDRIRVIEGLGSMSEATLKKTGTNVIRILVEAGYLDNNRSRTLQPVYLLPEVRSWLGSLSRQDLVPVMECTL